MEKEHPTELDHSAATTYTTLRDYLADHGPLVDRIGEPDGEFMEVRFPDRAFSFESRSLLPQNLDERYFTYKFNPRAQLLPGWTMRAGKVRPWFGYTGGATRVVVHDASGDAVTVRRLLAGGFLTGGSR